MSSAGGDCSAESRPGGRSATKASSAYEGG
jgi:hypothetical protein